MAKKRPMGPRKSGTKSASTTKKTNRIPIERSISYDKERKLYYVYHYLGKDPDGKEIKYYTTHTSKKDAQAERAYFQREKASGNVIAPSINTILDYTQAYIAAKKFSGREAATIEEYNKFYRHFEAYKPFQKTPIQKINTSHIVGYLTHLRDTVSLANNTIRKHHTFLNSVFNKALKERLISYNPVDLVEAPRKEETCAQHIPITELKAYLNAAKGTDSEAFILLLIMGLRRGELAGLRWEHVDLKKDILQIKETRVVADGDVVTKSTKSDSSIRTLAIPTTLHDVLQRTKRNQQMQHPGIRNMNHLYVIGKKDGSPYRPNHFNQLLKNFAKNHNLPYYRLHDFRHSAASVAHDAGLDLYDISKALGHSNISITADIYTHQLDNTNSTFTDTIFDSLDLSDRFEIDAESGKPQ